MGQDQSKPQGAAAEPLIITQQEITSSAEFLKDYQFKEKIDNDIQLLQHKTNGQLLATRELNLTDEAEQKNIYDNLQPKTLLVNQNIVRLFYCLKEKESQLCSTFFKVLEILEYVPNNLEKEVNNRIELKQPFSEDELWNILTQCIVGISYLYEHSISHDNIRPSTIYITPKGVIKVADPALLSQLTLYADTISQLNNIPSGAYLPPELLSAMFTQDYHPTYDQQKSDVFTLGMTIIHAALLQPLDDAYDYKNCTIDEGIVVQRLSKIGERYGQNLSKFLAAMVIMEPSERHDMLFLQQFLTQNSQSFAETPQHYAATQLALQQQQLQQDLDLNRQPANPSRQISRRSSQYSSQQQQQSFQTQAKNMKKEPDDTGSVLKYIPQDKESKLPIPDENPNTNGLGDGFLSMESDHQQEPELPVNLINNIEQRNGYLQNNNYNNNIDSNRINPPFKGAQLNSNNGIAQVNNTNTQSHNSSKMASNSFFPQQLPGSLSQPEQPSQTFKPSYTYSMHPTDPLTSPPVGINTSLLPKSNSISVPNNNPLNSQFNNLNNVNLTPNIKNPYMPAISSSLPGSISTNILNSAPLPVQNPVVIGQQQSQKHTPLSIQEEINKSAPPLIKYYPNNDGISAGNSTLPLSYPLSQQQQYNHQQQLGQGSFNNNSNTGFTYQPVSNIFSSPPFSNAPDNNKYAPDIEAILSKYRQPQQPSTGAAASSSGLVSQNNDILIIGSQKQPSSQSTESYSNIVNQAQAYSNLNSFKLQQNSNINSFPLGNQEINNPSYALGYPPRKEMVVESYQNNSKYEGEKLNGMRHGYGKFFYQDGGLFEGEWIQNKMHGKGILSYASGKPAYDGDWLDDKFEGFGSLYNENPADLRQAYDFSDFDNVDEYWTKYEGQFKDDNKEGKGTLYLSNGERYVGEFDKDFVSGQGVFYPLGGQPFHGTWDQNKLVQ